MTTSEASRVCKAMDSGRIGTYRPTDQTMLSYQDGRPTRIVACNFTWAIPGGMWLRDENGTIDWVAFPVIERVWGKPMLDRLFEATAGWLTGTWREVQP